MGCQDWTSSLRAITALVPITIKTEIPFSGALGSRWFMCVPDGNEVHLTIAITSQPTSYTQKVGPVSSYSWNVLAANWLTMTPDDAQPPTKGGRFVCKPHNLLRTHTGDMIWRSETIDAEAALWWKKETNRKSVRQTPKRRERSIPQEVNHNPECVFGWFVCRRLVVFFIRRLRDLCFGVNTLRMEPYGLELENVSFLVLIICYESSYWLKCGFNEILVSAYDEGTLCANLSMFAKIITGFVGIWTYNSVSLVQPFNQLSHRATFDSAG